MQLSSEHRVRGLDRSREIGNSGRSESQAKERADCFDAVLLVERTGFSGAKQRVRSDEQL